MIEIVVELGPNRYPVQIGHGIAGMLPQLLGPFRGRRLVVVSNPRVWSLHGRRVERGLASLGPLARLLIPEGEAHKSRATLEALHDGMFAAGLQRDGVVVAFGGGVVGDVAGFAAATYMRGVDLVQIPTTLLAMVDSAIGGKVGINHPQAKNLIGAFHQPRAVLSDPAFLDTLPARELQSGAYEVLKCGIIGDRGLFKAMQRAQPGLRGFDRVGLENAVASAARIKGEVVEADERESDRRRVLNLGHTLGHALEAVTRYRRFTHGEAVGWGLIGAAGIAWRRGLLSESAFDGIAAAVDGIGPRPRISDLPVDRILKAASRDKKVRGGRATFVLPAAVGRVVIRNDVTVPEVRRALRMMAAREARLG
jgi:3-dehydroquinate synthase